MEFSTKPEQTIKKEKVQSKQIPKFKV